MALLKPLLGQRICNYAVVAHENLYIPNLSIDLKNKIHDFRIDNLC